MATLARLRAYVLILLASLVSACVIHVIVSLCLYLWHRPTLLQAVTNEPWHGASAHGLAGVAHETRRARTIGSSHCEQYSPATIDGIDGEHRLLIISMGFPLSCYSLTREVFVPYGDNVGPLEWYNSTSWREGVELPPRIQAVLKTQASIVPVSPSPACVIDIILWTCVTYTCLYAVRYSKQSHRRRTHCCLSCGYPTKEIVACPECGRKATPGSGSV